MQLVQIRQIPADCTAERVLHVQVVRPAGRAERNNERGRKGDGNEARGKDVPHVCR